MKICNESLLLICKLDFSEVLTDIIRAFLILSYLSTLHLLSLQRKKNRQKNNTENYKIFPCSSLLAKVQEPNHSKRFLYRQVKEKYNIFCSLHIDFFKSHCRNKDLETLSTKSDTKTELLPQ